MTFFTQAITDGTIDEKTILSEKEFESIVIAKVLESNAWERHQRIHKDAQISSFSEEGGFSEIEKKAGPKHEDRPAITYDSNTKNFVIGCNCGKEKFVFDMKNDNVKSAGPDLKMKDSVVYNQNITRDNDNKTYGGNVTSTNAYGNITGYNSGPQTPNSPYQNNSQNSSNYRK